MSDNLPFPFNFYLEIIKKDHLHFGYWPVDSGNIDLEDAQENLSVLVYKAIPRKPCKILDVGCGLGVTAYELAKSGHEVTAIAPSSDLISYASNKYQQHNLTFLNSCFFEFAGEQKEKNIYDVILFQESLQYLHPIDKVFSTCRNLLCDKGRVVLCDEVMLDLSISGKTAVHPCKDIIVSIFENGFYIKKKQDLGVNVKPTCQKVIERLKNLSDSLQGLENKNDLDKLLDGWKSQQEWYDRRHFTYMLMNIIKDDIRLRPYNKNDENVILPLFNEIFHTSRSMKHWEWKFMDNPFGKRMIALAVDSHDNIAAHYSAYPVRFYSAFPEYESFLSCQAGDTMTTPAYRSVGLGPTSVLSRTAYYFYEKFCQDKFPFMYGFNTGNIRKFGEKYLEYIYNEQVPCYTLERRSVEKGMFHHLKNRLWYRILARRIDKPDNVFDSFFHEVKENFSLIVVRDLQYLKWRYFDAPDTDYMVYGLFSKGLMSGWAVFKRQDDRLIMGDFLINPACGDLAGLLFDTAFQDNPWAVSISSWCSPAPQWCSQILTRAGFEPHEEPNQLAPGFKVFDAFFSGQTFQDNFYYTMGDSDLF